MSLKERGYTVLVVSAAEKLNTALSGLLQDSRCQPARIVKTVSAGKRALSERSYDFVVVNSPLPDDTGVRFAIDTAGSGSTVVLLLVREELYSDTYERVLEYGVYTASKPISIPMLTAALDWMGITRERLRKMEKKTLSIEDKMEEIRLVNRAKWLLISELRMEEPQAHRYIEKQAMDRCISRQKVAEEIIKTYS